MGTESGEINLLSWYWDLQKRRERESDAVLYIDSFSNAVSVPVSKLKSDLSRAHAVLFQQEIPRKDSGDAVNSDCENERAWARLFIQLMKEVRACFVFDQLSHGNDRMKVSVQQVFPSIFLMLHILG